MKKFLSIVSVALVLFLFTTTESEAQLPASSVGIGSNFSNGVPGLSFYYAFSNSFDLGLNLGYTSTTQDFAGSSSSSSQMQVGLSGRIFVADTKNIDPFVSLGFNYSDSGLSVVESAGADATAFAVSVMFGGQTEIATNFFVYIATGLVYGSSSAEQTVLTETQTSTNSVINLGTTAVGALIYF